MQTTNLPWLHMAASYDIRPGNWDDIIILKLPSPTSQSRVEDTKKDGGRQITRTKIYTNKTHGKIRNLEDRNDDPMLYLQINIFVIQKNTWTKKICSV